MSVEESETGGGGEASLPAPPAPKVSKISLPQTKSSLFGTSANMVNSIVGAGIVGIPYAIQNAGFVMGVALIFLVGVLTNKSLRMIVELAAFHPKLKHLGVHTYEDLMSIPYGKVGRAFVLVSMFVLAFGAMVAYLLIIKDTVPTILNFSEAGEGNFWEAELTMFVISVTIILPLSMMRDMASLAFTSFLSVLADVILVGYVVTYAPVKSSLEENGGFLNVVKDNWVNNKLFIGLGVISTSMACQHSAFIVSNSLDNRTSQRWGIVTFRSISTATLMCALMGGAGYLAFLDETEGDILNNFASDSREANAGRALLAVTMIFTYPMECFVARHVFVQLFYGGDMDGNYVGPHGEVIQGKKYFGFFSRRGFITLCIYILTLLPSLVVDDLGPVLSLTGSLGASCISYVAAGLVYLGINGDDFLKYCVQMLVDRGYKVDKKPKPMIPDLPVAGDATATLPSNDENAAVTLPRGLKPWWWYLGLFPIWTAIASSGSHGTRNFLQKLEGNLYDTSIDEETETIGANKRDFYVSMFFIIFGVIAGVFGVASNIYVQVNNIFYTPT